jgi:hypothetical protein
MRMRAAGEADRGIPAKINLIPFNEWPGAPYERSDWDRIERLCRHHLQGWLCLPIRTPRGEDIMAACGQLKSATERARKSPRPDRGGDRRCNLTLSWFSTLNKEKAARFRTAFPKPTNPTKD